MAAPESSWLDTLSPVQQLFVQGVVLIITACGMAYGYLRKLKPDPVTSKDVILTGAGLMDMSPVRDLSQNVSDLNKSMTRIAVAAEEVRDLMKEQAEDEEVERRVRERLAAAAAQIKP